MLAISRILPAAVADAKEEPKNTFSPSVNPDVFAVTVRIKSSGRLTTLFDVVEFHFVSTSSDVNLGLISPLRLSTEIE